jgi:4-amino-4-deoxy-L-arabinose transferase-like glycosyltransferase
MRRERIRDYTILLAIAAVITLPNLGATSLWDDDEGVNAQAAREMRDNGTWVIPTFNYQLRTAKPVMLYWLERASYNAFGVSEWSARLPSALAAFLTMLLTYELARRMFSDDRGTGMIAAIVLASAFEFCMLARAATPDAVLLLFTVLTYYLFWTRHERGSRKWWLPTGAACGLAVLTKGPVGVALPGLVILCYLVWNREARRLLDRKLLVGAAAFVLVAGPWYAFVAADTRGEWARVFFGRENLQRFSVAMEGHRGSIFYHAGALFVLFAPWSVFLCAAIWFGLKGTANREPKASEALSLTSPSEAPVTSADHPDPLPQRPYRFLICWVFAYLVFFSAAATKLPNYTLPLYPALAILTARFLTRWSSGELVLPRWVMRAATVGVVVTGLAVGVGLLIASDAIPMLPAGARVFPGLARWAILCAIPLAAAVAMFRADRANDRARYVRSMAIAAVAFTALLAAFPPLAVDERKAPRELVRESGVADPNRDLRLAHYDWFQPSVVFYAGREVPEMKSPELAAGFLAVPAPSYLFVSEAAWEKFVVAKVAVPTRVAARHYDFLRNCEVLVITNDMPASAGQASMNRAARTE